MYKKNLEPLNYYKILGIDDTSMSFAEIRKKYVKLAVKFHPDKNKDIDPKIFSKIQTAWNCLGNVERRNIYDDLLKNEKNIKKNLDLKELFKNYVELTSKDENYENKKNEAKNEYDKLYLEVDKKNNFDRNQYKEKGLTDEIMSSKYDNLLLEREQSDIEFVQNNIFPSGIKFDTNIFNTAFELYKKNPEQDSVVEKNTSIVKKIEEPAPWNNLANIESSNFTDVNSFDKVFDSSYSNLNFGPEVKLKTNYSKLKTMSEKMTNDIDNSNEEYKKELNNRILEREKLTNLYNNTKYCDYDSENKLFMFSHKMDDPTNFLEIDDGCDDFNMESNDACDKLMELDE